jgi:heterotetrameric sarcosine oxidase gamma subunit
MADLARTPALGGAEPAILRAPGFELREHPFVPMLRLQALRADLAALSASGSDLLPATPNRALGDDPWILWRAPGDWLAYSLASPLEELERGLRPRLAPFSASSASPLYWTDVSSTGALFEIGGPRAIEVLMRDCTLDLEGGAVPAGACAQTAIAQLTVMIHRPAAAPAWRLWVDRTAARHLWEWLADSVALAAPLPSK